MMLRHGALGVVAGLAVLSLLAAGCSSQEPEDCPAEAGSEETRQAGAALDGGHRLSGPFGHENLAVFVVHGSDTIEGDAFLTLDEALERKLLVVHETGTVNELTADNLSESESIFLQRGEIVSGGKQDRVMGTDLIVSPGQRGVKITSYCVESGRWHARGAAPVKRFTTNANFVNAVAIELETFRGRQQALEWKKVEGRQQALLASVPKMALDKRSPTSIDLTLENRELKAAVKRYTDALSKSIDGKGDAVGLVFAINGKLTTAEVYGSNALFKKLWPKLLRASAADAIAARQKGKTFEPPSVADATAWLTHPREGDMVKRKLDEILGGSAASCIIETDADVTFDTRHSKGAGSSVHKSVAKKAEP